MKHACLVCGFPELQEPPRSKSGGGSYEICPCCGYQYGVDDDDRRVDYTQARAAWVQGGLRWHSRSQPAPASWNAQAQLAALATNAPAKSAAPGTNAAKNPSPKGSKGGR